jgi:hypothetical protein
MGPKRRTHRCEHLAKRADKAQHSESQSGLIAQVEGLRAIRSKHGNWNR